MQKRDTPNDAEKNYDPGCGRVKRKQKLRKETTKEKKIIGRLNIEV